MIELRDVEKTYSRGSEKVRALKWISLDIGRGDLVSVTGPSGSGKTTLLHLIGCLDTPTRGIIRIDGVEVARMGEPGLVSIRRNKIGFVFQQFYLMPGLSVVENVRLPLIFARRRKDPAAIESIIERVGLKERMHHNPNQLSGGEMQRVAIARALVLDPEILLADEPTGNLDSDYSDRIFELLAALNAGGLTVVMVTHNPELAARAKRIIRLKDGRIQGDRNTGTTA